MPDFNLKMPFWIDTDAYSDRDREMFVCGVEFEMIYQTLCGWTLYPLYFATDIRNELL